MMPVYMGYTPRTPDRERLANEVESYQRLLEEQPDNTYFKARLAAAQKALAVLEAPPFSKGGQTNAHPEGGNK